MEVRGAGGFCAQLRGGLQTQSASSWVERLELYGIFHASESPANRKAFTAVIQSTVNVSI